MRQSRILKVLTAASLLLCTAVIALWIGSHFRCSQVSGRRSETSCVFVVCPKGDLVISRETGLFAADVRGLRVNLRAPALPLEDTYSINNAIIRIAGLVVFDDADSSGSSRGVVIPFWMLAVATAATSIYLVLRNRPHAPGTCRVCGYNMLATPHRCPECGTAPADGG